MGKRTFNFIFEFWVSTDSLRGNRSKIIGFYVFDFVLLSNKKFNRKYDIKPYSNGRDMP